MTNRVPKLINIKYIDQPYAVRLFLKYGIDVMNYMLDGL